VSGEARKGGHVVNVGIRKDAELRAERFVRLAALGGTKGSAAHSEALGGRESEDK